MKKNLSLTLIALMLTVSCAKKPEALMPNSVPKFWYNSDTDNTIPGDEEKVVDPVETKALAQTIDTILNENASALEEGDAEIQNLSTEVAQNNEGKPKDWVPWRAEYFMTDLSLSGSGLIGALTSKGTSTVRAYWRRQGPVQKDNKNLEPNASSEESTSLDPVVVVQYDSSAEQMLQQLNPAVNAAVLTGKIKDTPEFRKNLLQAAQDFQTIALSIPQSTEELPWWVSRFRLDFSVDAAGKVEPVVIGSEVRFRFEWHRIHKLKPINLPLEAFTERQLNIRKSLQEFIVGTAHDLGNAFESHEKAGFKAHQMRIGLGVSAKGDIGVVKGSAGIVGQIYFTRNVNRPIVRPHSFMSTEKENPILVIERNPTPAHLHFAVKNKIAFETSSTKSSNGFAEVIYKLDRQKFRKGITKAAKIGLFFAERAAKTHFKSWKIYELRTAFDASVSGSLDLVTLAGSATAQISFFNQKF